MSWGHECVRDETGHCQQCVALGHANYINPDFGAYMDLLRASDTEIDRLWQRLFAIRRRHWASGVREIYMPEHEPAFAVVDARNFNARQAPAAALIEEATGVGHALARAQARRRDIERQGWQTERKDGK